MRKCVCDEATEVVCDWHKQPEQWFAAQAECFAARAARRAADAECAVTMADLTALRTRLEAVERERDEMRAELKVVVLERAAYCRLLFQYVPYQKAEAYVDADEAVVAARAASLPKETP